MIHRFKVLKSYFLHFMFVGESEIRTRNFNLGKGEEKADFCFGGDISLMKVSDDAAVQSSHNDRPFESVYSLEGENGAEKSTQTSGSSENSKELCSLVECTPPPISTTPEVVASKVDANKEVAAAAVSVATPPLTDGTNGGLLCSNTTKGFAEVNIDVLVRWMHNFGFCCELDDD